MITLEVDGRMFQVPAEEIGWRAEVFYSLSGEAEAARLWGMLEAVGA